MKNTATTATSVSPIDTFLNRLENVQHTKDGRWRARCPSHQDSKSKGRTLSIMAADNGGVVCNCFAGCSIDQIVGAINLELKDLYPRDDYIKFVKGTQRHPHKDLRIVLKQAKGAATIVEVGARTLSRGETLSEEDLIVLAGASNDLREMLNV